MNEESVSLFKPIDGGNPADNGAAHAPKQPQSAFYSPSGPGIASKIGIMKQLICAAVSSIVLLGFGSPFASAGACPATGNAHSAGVRALNILKNRATAPKPDQINRSATLRAILAHGEDYSRWYDKRGAQIIGYVIDVRPGGIETANCRARDLAHRDTHIEIALTRSAPETARMIVEVTPTWRRKMAQEGFDWSTHRLEQVLPGKRVLIRGWLMFDKEHAGQSENTAPGRPGDWRATAWEIHPITGIAVLTNDAILSTDALKSTSASQ